MASEDGSREDYLLLAPDPLETRPLPLPPAAAQDAPEPAVEHSEHDRVRTEEASGSPVLSNDTVRSVDQGSHLSGLRDSAIGPAGDSRYHNDGDGLLAPMNDTDGLDRHDLEGVVRERPQHQRYMDDCPDVFMSRDGASVPCASLQAAEESSSENAHGVIPLASREA
ncbi:hypothetical protein C8T65DRAFT_748777 [Cerioporus squamosus]|nr:hypothetical protein C8T65DRAFT_748777 [Cerioporus squamosus]